MTTHPRVLFVLVFLLTAVAKRDVVGRKPKKAVFAREGLAVLEREGWGDVLIGVVEGQELGDQGGHDRGGRVEFDLTGPEVSRACIYPAFMMTVIFTCESSTRVCFVEGPAQYKKKNGRNENGIDG
jgi:hypothetical protein